MSDRPDAERVHALMMRGLDEELDPDEVAELERLIADDPKLAEEWHELRGVHAVTRELGYREPPAEVWEEYWHSVYNRVERGLGWMLLSAGTVVLLGYAIWHMLAAMLTESTAPGFVRTALFCGLLGGVVLFVSVAREKWFAQRRDPYRGIQR